MAEALFRRTITTLDLADGQILLEPTEEKVLQERFGFADASPVPIVWGADERSTARLGGGYLRCPDLRSRPEFLYQVVEFAYAHGALLLVREDDPERELALQTLALQRQIEEATSTIHHEMQGVLAEIGAALGYDVWVAAADRVRVLRYATNPVSLLEDLPPITQDAVASQVARLIDVIFVPREPYQQIKLFDVESTTNIASGLLRLADVNAWRGGGELYIVSHDSRRAKYERELRRPTFHLISSIVQFRTYEEIRNWRKDVLRQIH